MRCGSREAVAPEGSSSFSAFRSGERPCTSVGSRTIALRSVGRQVNLLLVVLVSALGSVGLTVALRAVRPFSVWNENGVKPWACDLCMSFWGSALCLVIGACAGRVGFLDAFFLWMPAFAVAYGTIQRIVPVPMGDPPIDPPSAP